MKALVYRRYGSPDVLNIEEIDKPVPKNGEVLVRVHAASVNDWDWGLLTGKPWIGRIPGLFRPSNKILGADIAGQVEAVGERVTRFQVGDEVLGDISRSGWGGFAEFVCARENALTLKPAGMAFDQAAALPQAGVLGLLGTRDKGEIQPGQNVLINGAGGGAGTFAVQIAKYLGAEVTGVDSDRKLDVMRATGADHVIDYTQEDFTKNGQRYDLILDMAAHHSFFDYKRSLAPGGRYIMEGGSMGRILQAVTLGPLFSITGSKKMGILALRQNRGLDFLIELFEAGVIKPVIDKRFPLGEGAEALRYFGDRQTRGKIVITM